MPDPARMGAQAVADDPAPGEPPVRVLLVDDSAFTRHALSQALGRQPGITVVGTARDGQEALELLPRLRPDVVTLDVEMPRMDGREALRAIMARHPLPVVMLSSLTQEGARETVHALLAGAVDFVSKPQGRVAVVDVVTELARKIRRAAGMRVGAMAHRAVEDRPPPDSAPRARAAQAARPLGPHDRLVVIGASTGGPRALKDVLSRLPGDLPAAVLLVQHMPVGFTETLAERLNAVAAMPVREAADGDSLCPGQALLARGGSHLEVTQGGTVSLSLKPAVHGVRPSVDVTLASAVAAFGPATVAVVLTGMGHDGTTGAALVHAAGGTVLAQDSGTSVVWGMPRAVIEAGVADQVLALDAMADGIAGCMHRADGGNGGTAV